MNLPIYYCEINEYEDGIGCLSLVEHPATDSLFMCFSKQMNFSIDDEEKRIISGVIMEPDKPIYRNDNGREYYVVFTKETIRLMVEKFFIDGVNNRIDLEHNNKPVDGVHLIEMFIKDSDRGINPNYITCADGSLIGTYKVVDADLWQEIKNGTFKGFSLAGTFSLRRKNEYEDILEMLTKLRKVK